VRPAWARKSNGYRNRRSSSANDKFGANEDLEMAAVTAAFEQRRNRLRPQESKR
jgi:hypothetical protein